MPIILLTLLAIVIACVYLWLRHNYAYWMIRKVPHEKPVFFFGNMSGIGRRYHWKDINQRIYNRFKGTAPFVGMYTFLSKTAFILDLELVRNILIKDFPSFANRGLFHNVRDDPLTGNLLFLDGEQWRVLRHKLSPVFTTGKIRYMFSTIVEVGERLIDVCNQLMAEDLGAELEVKDICARYTTDVIGTCAFGIECNSLRDPNAEFRRMGRSIFDEPRHSPLLQAFMFANPDLARRLRMKNFSDDVSTFFMNAVHETVKYREKHNVNRNDFMDLLIELKKQREEKSSKGTKYIADDDDLSTGLTLEQIAAQAMFFFLAGFETSSSTMSFCLYELALNPSVQEELRREIVGVLKRYNGQLSYENVKEMLYLDQVISETLRKYSVIPLLARQTITDYKVPNTEIVFEKGLRIVIPVDAIHNDPKIYPEPEKFKPERFRPEEIASRHPMSYLPFGDGPRNCIGMRFGKLQTQIGIITLLRHFRFSTIERTQIPLRFSRKSFPLATEIGIHLKVEKLRN